MYFSRTVVNVEFGFERARLGQGFWVSSSMVVAMIGGIEPGKMMADSSL